MLIKVAKQWIASPLGLNILYSKIKNNTNSMEKYLQIANILQEREVCSIDNKLFISPTCKNKDEIKNAIQLDAEEINFDQKENLFSSWVNKYGGFKASKEISSMEYILANVTLFQSSWSCCTGTGPRMKIHNSYNYTLDVKYEARIIEMLLKSQVNLVILVPNEVDLLGCLFKRLQNEGLQAAVRSIQPLFTTTAIFTAPSIDVTSKVVYENVSGLPNTTIVQYGNLFADEQGVFVKVLTCMYGPHSDPVTKDKTSEEQPFYLGLVYNDIPLFIGQFTKD